MIKVIEFINTPKKGHKKRGDVTPLNDFLIDLD